jgi:uncharacterized membrane protein YbhN (UPF0104 family)
MQKVLHRSPRDYARLAALVLLAVVTLVGLRSLSGGNWREAWAQWQGQGGLLALVGCLRLVDLAVDFALWYWVMREFEISIRPARSFLVYLCAGAGVLLPAQLGRFIRSDALARQGSASLGKAVEAELAFLYLSMVGAMGLLIGALAYAWWTWTGPLAALASIAAACVLLKPVTGLLRRIGINIPVKVSRLGPAYAIAVAAMMGWFLNGIMLYLLLQRLPGEVKLWQTALIVPSNLLAGVLSGLPGGIGAVEGLMGISLRYFEVPSEHLALSVGVFRLFTFWLWLPVGWVAFIWFNRITPKRPVTDPAMDLQHAE